MPRDNFRRSSTDENLRAFDAYAHAYTTIDENHRMMHDGMYYLMYQRFGQIATLDLSIDTGDLPMHLTKFRIDYTDLGGRLSFYENSASIDGGTDTFTNANRMSERTALSIVRLNPTIQFSGDLLFQAYGPVAGGSVPLCDSQDNEEVILKPNTEHLVRFDGLTPGNRDVNLAIAMYEIDYEL